MSVAHGGCCCPVVGRGKMKIKGSMKAPKFTPDIFPRASQALSNTRRGAFATRSERGILRVN